MNFHRFTRHRNERGIRLRFEPTEERMNLTTMFDQRRFWTFRSDEDQRTIMRSEPDVFAVECEQAHAETETEDESIHSDHYRERDEEEYARELRTKSSERAMHFSSAPLDVVFSQAKGHPLIYFR